MAIILFKSGKDFFGFAQIDYLESFRRVQMVPTDYGTLIPSVSKAVIYPFGEIQIDVSKVKIKDLLKGPFDFSILYPDLWSSFYPQDSWLTIDQINLDNLHLFYNQYLKFKSKVSESIDLSNDTWADCKLVDFSTFNDQKILKAEIETLN
jgi:hypothetical protein